MHVSLAWKGFESSHQFHILYHFSDFIINFDAQINGLNVYFLHLSLVSKEMNQPASVFIRFTRPKAFFKMNNPVPKVKIDFALISLYELLQNNCNILNILFQFTIKIKLD